MGRISAKTKKIPIGDEIHQICFRFNIGVKKISQILDISIESASELLDGNYQIFPFENLISYSEKMKHWKDSEGKIYEKKEDLMQKIRHLRVVHGLTLGGMAERLRVPEKERNRIFNGNLRSSSIEVLEEYVRKMESWLK